MSSSRERQGRLKALHQDSPSRALILLATPIIGAMFLEVAFNLVDGIWVGRVGTDAFAAVNLASFSLWTLHSLAGIVSTGTNSVVAQLVGREQEEKARAAAAHGLAMATILGLVLALPVTLWGRTLLRMMAGPSAEMSLAVELAYVYLALTFVFAPAYCLLEAISAAQRAYGDARTPALIYTGGFVLNLLLDPLLIFGLGPFPKLGVLGAAIATVVSFAAALLVCLWLLSAGRLVFSLPKTRPSWDGEMARDIIRIGFPPSLANVVFCVVYMAVSPVIGHYGPESLAALGIGHRILSFSYLLCYGFSLATITVVGQSVGAGKLVRARRSGWEAVKLVTLWNGAVTAGFYLFAWPLSALFTTDPQVQSIAVSYLRIIAFSQIFMGAGMVLEGAFAGFGRTVPPTVISISAIVMRVPGARWVGFTLGLGIEAVWWVFCVLTTVRGLLIGLLYSRTEWGREPETP